MTAAVALGGKNLSRPWYDGAGKDKRLRVVGVVDAPPPVLPERPSDGPDPGDVREIHEASKKALADGDEHAIGKLYEDLLDEVHSASGQAHPADPWLRLRIVCPDFEQALESEMRALARADARWGWAYRLVDEGLEVLLRDPEKESWACAVDLRALLHAAETYTGARAFASTVVGRARREILSARARSLLGGSIPTVGVA